MTTHHRRRRSVLVITVALVAAAIGIAGSSAEAANPPVTLNPTSGPAGTTTTVTLPSPCGSPTSSATLYVNVIPVVGYSGGGYSTVPIAAGTPLTSSGVTVTSGSPKGTYYVDATCYLTSPFTVTTYGRAYFDVTGGPSLPTLTVSPTSGPVGTVVDVSGPCHPAPGRPRAALSVVVFNRSDPDTSHIAYATASGPGPIVHTKITVPAFLASGTATIAASCFDYYATSTTFAQSSFTVTGGVKVSIGDASVVEGQAKSRSARFTLSLSQPSAQDVSVSYLTAGGDAVAGTDYTATSGTATIVAGSTSTTVSVPVRGDTTVESKESFGVWLTGPTGGAVLDRSVGIGRIIDDDPAQGLKVAVGDASVVEGNRGTRSFRITVTLSNVSASAVSVHYATANDTATAGVDYTATSGTATIAAGQTSAVISVPVRVDTTAESIEAFTVKLSAPSGATIGRTTGVGKILDDDQP